MTTPDPPGEGFGLSFDEWLEKSLETREPELVAESDGEPKADETRTSALPADIRAMLSTVPLGVAWLLGCHITSKLSRHPSEIEHRLILIGLAAWTTSLACELSIAYSRGLRYPRFGMWDWHIRPTLIRQNSYRHTAFGPAVLIILTLFILSYVSRVLLAFAVPIWIMLMTLVTGIHLTATLVRHSWRR